MTDNDGDCLARVHLFICVTCRRTGDPPSPDGPSSGARLYAAVTACLTEADASIAIAPVECLSACNRPCAIAFAAAGKWTYVYGDLPHDSAAQSIVAGARLYADTSDGLVPWTLRPAMLKSGVVARVPPVKLPSVGD